MSQSIIYRTIISERDTCDDGPFDSFKAELFIKDKRVAAMDYILYDHCVHQASYEDILLNMDDLSVNHSEWYKGTLAFVSPHFIYIEDIRSFRKNKGYGQHLLEQVTGHYLKYGCVMGGCLPDSDREGYSDLGCLMGFYEFQGYHFKGQCFYKQPRIGTIL
jgi:GNAT superfamily N-acetyltransferase